MDKTLAFFFILFFALCAGFVTIAAIDTPKRSKKCKFFAILYALIMWVDVLVITVITIIY